MKHQRIMAHCIDVGGKGFRLSIAETDSFGYLIGIKPYESETANTEFRNGTVKFRTVSRRRVMRAKFINQNP